MALNMKLKQRNKNLGFTLIEIMVVIVIMGIMAALVVPRVMSSTDDARKAAAVTDIKAMTDALKMYKLHNLNYPTQQQGLDALVNKPTISPIPKNYTPGGYLEKLPKDPWHNDYQYQNPGKHGDVDIYSYGADGPTSAGENGTTVVGNWQ